ncbi:MAG: SET domain-containing protein [Gammaproteobacteria bacterium]|nr:SET domain-containing protein [Gammaproteobacteria bacterium]MDH3448439.1 SET domain-containing protein [Gammaproteobacteria bacterium]
MIKNTYVAQSGIHGKGLFASSLISSGTIIGWLQGRPCREDGCHVLWISQTQGIEVICDLKYINHSDRPNACYYDDLSVVALRDIQPDEEITHNYASNDW